MGIAFQSTGGARVWLRHVTAAGTCGRHPSGNHTSTCPAATANLSCRDGRGDGGGDGTAGDGAAGVQSYGARRRRR
eukprot:2585934-Rhodomonas_salina.1